jgi:hypothetical protein
MSLPRLPPAARDQGRPSQVQDEHQQRGKVNCLSIEFFKKEQKVINKITMSYLVLILQYFRLCV